MNIAVIGLGSMGKRRIRLIREMYPDYRIWGIDGREDRRNEAQTRFDIIACDSLDEVEKKARIDCAFVCTSPLSHASIIHECLLKGWNVFTELNLVDTGYEENMKLAAERGVTLFLSSTFYYREEIKYIRSKILEHNKWNYIYHVGQYLPDWHPWENYKDFFVGEKRTNGCREIFAIELPWITGTFGDVEEMHVIADKITSLNIGFDDNYLVEIKHRNGNKGILVADVVSPVAVRKLEVYSEGKYLSWNGTPESLYVFDANDKQLKQVSLSEKTEHEGGYSAFVVENAYKNEINEFFDVVVNGKTPSYGFAQDRKILKLIDSIGA